MVCPDNGILFSKMKRAIKPWKGKDMKEFKYILLILLSGRSQSEKAIHCMIPSV